MNWGKAMVGNYRHWGLAAALLLPLAACGTGNDFVEPIKTFAAATAKAGETFTDASKELDKALAEQRLRGAVARASTISPLDKECLPSSRRCRLGYQGAGDIELEVDPGAAIPVINAIMADIARYGDGLAVVAAADLDGQVKAGFDKLKGSALSLVASAEELAKARGDTSLTGAGAKVKALAEPLASIGSAVFGAVLESRKRAVMRDAVAAMEADFPRIVVVLGAATRAGYQQRRARAIAAFNVAQQKFDLSRRTEAEVRAYADAARTADVVLNARPEDIFVALGKAHTALHEALQRNETDLSEVWKQLSLLAVEVGKLRDAIEAMKKESDAKAADEKK
jgi:hypothetical protein